MLSSERATKKLMSLLLDHPAVRDAFQIRLNTRDAEVDRLTAFYEPFGFERVTPRADIVPMVRCLC